MVGWKQARWSRATALDSRGVGDPGQCGRQTVGTQSFVFTEGHARTEVLAESLHVTTLQRRTALQRG